jgi:hypothetical protein
MIRNPAGFRGLLRRMPDRCAINVFRDLVPMPHQSAGAADWQSRHWLGSEPVIDTAGSGCGKAGANLGEDRVLNRLCLAL